MATLLRLIQNFAFSRLLIDSFGQETILAPRNESDTKLLLLYPSDTTHINLKKTQQQQRINKGTRECRPPPEVGRAAPQPQISLLTL